MFGVWLEYENSSLEFSVISKTLGLTNK